MLSTEIQIRVGYKDTDAMGVVHHSNYLVYYEIARTEMLRRLGSTYKIMEAGGIMMPVLEVSSKYYASAKYDDLLTVKVRVPEMPGVRMTFEYEIFNEAGELLNTGRVTLVFIHTETRKATRAPKWFTDLLTANNI